MKSKNKTRCAPIRGPRWPRWASLTVLTACLCAGAGSGSTQAQTLTLDWWTADGGGGTSDSTDGRFSLSGTIGQPDAGLANGGNDTLLGGFWGVAFPVQTPGAPWLEIVQSNSMVIVSWRLPATGWTLEFTNALPSNPCVWPRIPPPYPTSATHCVVTEPWVGGSKFYRLCKP